MTRLLTTFAVLTALGTASAQVPEAWKDWPPEVFDRIGVVPIGATSRAAALSADVPMPLTMGAQEAAIWAVPVPVDNGDRLMRARLASGDLSAPVRAWLRTLSPEALTNLVETTPRHTDDHDACDAVVETLMAVQAPNPHGAGWSDRTLLRVADYYRDRDDERCVPLYEQLLAKRTMKTDGWVPELFGLGTHYRATGRPDRVIEVFRSTQRFTTNKDVIADYEVEALRVLAASGQMEQAFTGYERLMSQELTPRRRWIVVGDMYHVLETRGRIAESQMLRENALAGRWGPEVAVRTRLSLATDTRIAAIWTQKAAERERLNVQAQALYKQAVAEWKSSVASASTHSPAASDLVEKIRVAEAFADYLSAELRR